MSVFKREESVNSYGSNRFMVLFRQSEARSTWPRRLVRSSSKKLFTSKCSSWTRSECGRMRTPSKSLKRSTRVKWNVAPSRAENTVHYNDLQSALCNRVPVGILIIAEVNRRTGGCSGSADAAPSFLFERGHHLIVEAPAQIRCREGRVAHEASGLVALRVHTYIVTHTHTHTHTHIHTHTHTHTACRNTTRQIIQDAFDNRVIYVCTVFTS